jgi:hypothetical protein
MATVSMDSIQFYHPNSIHQAASNKSAPLVQIEPQPTAAKTATRRVEKETALTRTSAVSFDTDDDDNELPSLNELLRRPLHNKNSLKGRAIPQSVPQGNNPLFYQRDHSSSNAGQSSLASSMGNSIG